MTRRRHTEPKRGRRRDADNGSGDESGRPGFALQKRRTNAAVYTATGTEAQAAIQRL